MKLFGKNIGDSGKLKASEIQETVEKIRRLYSRLITEYNRPEKIKTNFENRYISAIRTRANLGLFLQAEIGAITELLEKEKYRRIQEDTESQVRERIKNEQSVADRVIQEQRKRIKKYPPLGEWQGKFSEEINKLYGALYVLSYEHWLTAEQINREYYGVFSQKLWQQVGQKMYIHCASSIHQPPPSLERYIKLTHLPLVSQNEIDKEEKQRFYEIAHFLKTILKCLESAELGLTVPADKIEQYNKLISYVEGILKDFRLTDLVDL